MKTRGINHEEGAEARDPLDFYPTTLAFAVGACRALLLGGIQPEYVLDPGAGTGIWGQAARGVWPGALIAGIEINREREKPDAYDHWHHEDFTVLNPQVFSRPGLLVIGNPPYFLAEVFVWRSLDALPTGGHCGFLLKAAFWMGGQSRHQGLFRFNPPKTVYKLPRRPYPDHSEDYVFLLWEKGWTGETLNKVMWW